jgi:lipopolysaccharide transport system ATP-binding protein
MSDVVIKVEGLGKQYRIGKRERYKTFREAVVQMATGPFRRLKRAMTEDEAGTFWALQDVNFEVNRGEVVGIVGRNGAGKSTLLKILSRITEPTRGRVEITGRVGSLLEVGTGFHPELTGRENIYLNGAILGMTRAEISRKFDDIISFSEVEKFLDTQVKFFSSGMYMRLAFAVAAHLEPEILVVDEVLAVGDAAFQKKCLGKMGEVAQQGRTVLFVSHNMGAVQQLTQRCVLLHGGRVTVVGPTEAVLARYLDDSRDPSRQTYNVENVPRKWPGSGEIKFVSVRFGNARNEMIAAGAPLEITARLRARESVDHFWVSLTIFDLGGHAVGYVVTEETLGMKMGEEAAYRVELGDHRLAPGIYNCALGVGTGGRIAPRMEFDYIHEVLQFEMLAPLEAEGTPMMWNSWWGGIRLPPLTVRRADEG